MTNGLIAGSPAARNGNIQVGDHIVAIAQEKEESVNVSSMLFNKISKLLRGKKVQKFR
jgi:C-terminal processing protease CtpA/Prc